MAVLQVGIYVEALCHAVVGLQVYVGIVLCAVVAVVFVVGMQFAQVILYPQHLSVVPAEIAVCTTAQRCVQPLTPVVKREYGTAKMVVHRLLAYKVAALHLVAVVHEWLQGILHKLAALLVLLVVAVALCVVQANVHLPAVAELMVYKQLQVLLCVVVGLVIIVVRLAVGIGVHVAAAVVATAIHLHLLLARIVPGMVCLLTTGKGNEPCSGAVAIVCSLNIV